MRTETKAGEGNSPARQFQLCLRYLTYLFVCLKTSKSVILLKIHKNHGVIFVKFIDYHSFKCHNGTRRVRYGKNANAGSNQMEKQ